MNMSRDSDTTPASGVTGGDFDGSGDPTNLVVGTAIMPRYVYTLSDSSTGGNSAGTTTAGTGGVYFMGLLVSYTP